jgi:hypothetical protein
VTTPAIPCRLCGHEAKLYGRKLVLDKYEIAYYECGECQSLQTEQPYWLEEAYHVEGLGLDVGACQRCLNLSIEVSACLNVLGFHKDLPCLDYGSGLGLFSRLMRDRGYNFHAYDKYIKPFFMDRFEGSLIDRKWSVLTVFEVFEHMVTPDLNCAELFKADPDIIFFTTQLWQNQGLDWWYFVPEGGQHVFFFSDKGLQFLTDKYGFTLIDLKSVKIFLNNKMVKEYHALSMLQKVGYLFNKPWMARGKKLPFDIPSRLHLIKDRKTMKRLARHLFLKHQNNSGRWIEQDFNHLKLPSREAELP